MCYHVSMLHIETKYIGLISSQLGMFSNKKRGLYNFRCPFCGDSQSNKRKARGYLHHDKSEKNFVFKCHNCGKATSFTSFLKEINRSLYNEFLAETWQEKNNNNNATFVSTFVPKNVEKEQQPQREENYASYNFTTIKTLARILPNHSCVQYVKSRKIPQDAYDRLYYTNNFQKTVMAAFGENRIGDIPNDERLIIPIFDRESKLIAMQGRTLSKNKKAIRYVTVKKDDHTPKVYGLDRVDTNKTIFVVEGPIDSLFLPNAIAMCDSSLWNCVNYDIPKEKVVLIFDNQPKNKEIVNGMEKSIDLGFRIFFWSNFFSKYKDVNDFFMDEKVLHYDGYFTKIVNVGAFSGLRAKAEMAFWSKL